MAPWLPTARRRLVLLAVCGLAACKTTVKEERSISFAEKNGLDSTVLDSRLKQLETLAHDYPKRSDVPYQMAGVWYQKENYRESAKALERAIFIEPGEAKYYYHLGRVYLKMRELPKAEAAFRRAVERMPSDRYTGGRAALGYVLCLEGRFADARAEFEACARIDPKDPAPHYFLGCVADIERDREMAVAHLKEYIIRGGVTYRKKAAQILESYGEKPPAWPNALTGGSGEAAAGSLGAVREEVPAGELEPVSEGAGADPAPTPRAR